VLATIDEAEKQVISEYSTRMVKAFVDLLILREICVQPLSGHEVMRLLKDDCRLKFGAGQIYNKLEIMEKEGLVACEMNRYTKLWIFLEIREVFITWFSSRPESQF
jgi:hypothetical protein